MKTRDKLGRFGCVPLDLHPAWYELGWSSRALGMALFAHVTDRDAMTIEVAADWRTSLCKMLRIGGQDRRYVKPAMDELVRAGLLTVGDGKVTVNRAPCVLSECSVSAQWMLRECSVDASKSTQAPVNTQHTHPQKEEKDQNRESESARVPARTHTRERIPIGEAPPNTEPSEPQPISAEARCWRLYQQALGTEHLMLPMNHHDALRALACAAKAEADGSTHGEAFDRAVRRILAAWMAERYWQDNKPGLPNLKARLEAGRYAKPKVLKPAKTERRCYTDRELLAMSDEDERELDYDTKFRRWELKARAEVREAAE